MNNLNLNLDPRAAAVPARLGKIKNIIAVSGFKGGVGKSSAACILALVLAKKGFKAGLADLDFTSASCHEILGVKPGPGHLFPEEVEGLLPPKVGGVSFMSAAFFTSERALNLRGEAVSNAILELLAVSNWGELDYLVLDMPPGISDAALDVLKHIPQAQILCITTPSRLSKQILQKAVVLFKEMNANFLGYIENHFVNGMQEQEVPGLKFLGRVKMEYDFESFLGHPDLLLKSDFAKLFERFF